MVQYAPLQNAVSKICQSAPRSARKRNVANIHFKFSAMNAGKTTQLIQAAFNYKERGHRPYALKPTIDTRSAKNMIHARVGLDLECIEFGPGDSIVETVRKYCPDPSVLLFDEAQFMTESQVMELIILAKKCNIPIVCYGLKTDFSGNLFVGSAKLLAIADKFEVLKTVCWCGDGATQNARIGKDGNMVTVGNSIEVGDVGRYVPLCMKHYAAHQPTLDHVSDYNKYNAMISVVRSREMYSEVNDEPSNRKVSEVPVTLPDMGE